MQTTNHVRDTYEIADHYASVPNFAYASKLLIKAKSEVRTIWLSGYEAVLCYNEQSKTYDVYIVRLK